MNKLNLFFAVSIVGGLLLSACGGQSAPQAEPGSTEYSGAVQPLNNPDLLLLAAPDGRTSCGVFDLATSNPPTGWGDKTADLALWPACQGQAANLELLCLNGEAQWVRPAFEDVAAHLDKQQITWTSQQEGICGFFVK
jgi:hypothetical protein